MKLMGDGLIAFLAAVGVSTILWLLAETLLRRHSPVAEAVLVLPVRGGRGHAGAGSAPDHGAARDRGDPHPAGGLRVG